MFEEVLCWAVVFISLSCEQSWIEPRGYPGFKQHTRIWPSRNSCTKKRIKDQSSRRTLSIALWHNNRNRVEWNSKLHLYSTKIYSRLLYDDKCYIITCKTVAEIEEAINTFTRSCLQSDINISIFQTCSAWLRHEAFIQRQSLCNHCLDYRAGLCRKHRTWTLESHIYSDSFGLTCSHLLTFCLCYIRFCFVLFYSY